MVGGNHTVDFNGIENYFMHVPILPNIEISKPGLKIISGKYHDKDEFILNNIL